jgi:hypothetical protein
MLTKTAVPAVSVMEGMEKGDTKALAEGDIVGRRRFFGS